MATFLRRAAGLRLIFGMIFCGIASSQQTLATSSKAQVPPLAGLKVEHITFSVADLDREANWFGKVFGFKVFVREGGSSPMARNLSIPGFRIDLIHFEGSSRPPALNPSSLQQGFVHIVFQVPDLEAAYKQLQELNEDVTRETEPKTGLWGLRVHDPEGNEVELTQYGHI